ncbi:MAG: MBL fold metallo-hydrolase, partial [Bacteroidota bacterium]
LSNDPRDKRLRAAVLIQTPTQNVLIDAGPDFRQQLLNTQVQHLDAIFLTHEHNDHIIGLDDVRPFLFRKQKPMRIYCSQRVADDLKVRFAYAFAENPYPGAPRFDLQIINEKTKLSLDDLRIEPIAYWHGQMPVLGYKINDLAYLTDIKAISAAELDKVRGVRTLVISALHHDAHHSHLNLQEALAMIDEIAPQTAYITHLSHKMGLHWQVEPSLPPGVYLAYDGLKLNLS